MIKLICPSCNTALKGPDEFAGKAPKCPVCKQVAPAPPKMPEEAKDIVAELLAEVEEATAPSPKPAQKAEAVVSAPIPKKPAARPRRRWGPVLVTVLGILAVAGAGAFVWHKIAELRRKQRVETGLAQLKLELGRIDELYKNGKEKQNAGQFHEASKAYTSALERANRLAPQVAEWIEKSKDLAVHAELSKAGAELNARIKQISEALRSEEMEYGAKGLVKFDDKWVTPEEKEKLFVEKMKREGRSKFEHEGKVLWVTEDEKQELLGYKKWKGQWVPAAQYEALKKAEEERLAKEAALALQKQEEERKRRELAEQRRKQQEELQRQAREEAAKRFPPDAKVWVVDDFEEKSTWRSQTWANPVDVKIAQKDGSKQLQIELLGGDKDKSAITRNIDLDFSSRDKLMLDVINETQVVFHLAIALETPKWYESRGKPIMPGVNKGVSFNLKTGDFKSEATNWDHSTPVRDPENLKRLTLLIYTHRKGTVYIDNIVAIKGD